MELNLTLRDTMRNEWSGKIRDLNTACCQFLLDTPHIAKVIWGIRLPHRDFIGQRASPSK